MVPDFTEDGLLPPGVHWATWEEVAERFGGNSRREQLLAGLRKAVENLRGAGCATVYVNGSFVTNKDVPGDFDACWDEEGVDSDALDPVFHMLDAGRPEQKAKYLGELFPATAMADPSGVLFLDFFQEDTDSGEPKGIIAIDLGGLT